jgi:hypothetical protein
MWQLYVFVVLGRHVARIREVKGAYRILIGISENNISLERSVFRWEGKIKTDIERIRIGMCEADPFRWYCAPVKGIL